MTAACCRRSRRLRCVRLLTPSHGRHPGNGGTAKNGLAANGSIITLAGQRLAAFYQV